MTLSAPQQLPARFDAERARHEASTFNLRALPQGFIDNPFPFYAALRDFAPFSQQSADTWLVSRHADLVAIYKDNITFSSDKQAEFRPKFGDGLLYEHHTTSLIFNDAPLHTRVRKIMSGALTARVITDMEAPMTAMIDGLLDAMEHKGAADLVADFAASIPIEVIGNLLGIPREERHPLRDWSLAILGALEPAPTRAMLEIGEIAVRDFLSYLKQLTDDRRAKPRDPDRDVLTRLIIGEQGGEKLSEVELLQNCIFILNAGHETTTNLIANSLVSLLKWPEQKARLMAEPAMIGRAVEEFLRFESPVQLGNRQATRECDVGGVKLPKGAFINLVIGAANRDEREFPDPDQLDLNRFPNKHLAFASGIHFCVGLNVARLEGKVATTRFLKRFPNYRLSGLPVLSQRARFRGYLSIPVAFG